MAAGPTNLSSVTNWSDVVGAANPYDVNPHGLTGILGVFVTLWHGLENAARTGFVCEHGFKQAERRPCAISQGMSFWETFYDTPIDWYNGNKAVYGVDCVG